MTAAWRWYRWRGLVGLTRAEQSAEAGGGHSDGPDVYQGA